MKSVLIGTEIGLSEACKNHLFSSNSHHGHSGGVCAGCRGCSGVCVGSSSHAGDGTPCRARTGAEARIQNLQDTHGIKSLEQPRQLQAVKKLIGNRSKDAQTPEFKVDCRASSSSAFPICSFHYRHFHIPACAHLPSPLDLYRVLG